VVSLLRGGVPPPEYFFVRHHPKTYTKQSIAIDLSPARLPLWAAAAGPLHPRSAETAFSVADRSA